MKFHIVTIFPEFFEGPFARACARLVGKGSGGDAGGCATVKEGEGLCAGLMGIWT